MRARARISRYKFVRDHPRRWSRTTAVDRDSVAVDSRLPTAGSAGHHNPYPVLERARGRRSFNPWLLVVVDSKTLMSSKFARAINPDDRANRDFAALTRRRLRFTPCAVHARGYDVASPTTPVLARRDMPGCSSGHVARGNANRQVYPSRPDGISVCRVTPLSRRTEGWRADEAAPSECRQPRSRSPVSRTDYT